jgi:hypothetical protein
MTTIVHKADTRGHANHGWLDSHHTFSFAGYHDPQRVHFGALRVLNDDTVAPGMGFGTHPHDNMEIISIPLSGELKHRDTMGTETVIKTGDVQIMSAGSGLQHSEMNNSRTEPVKFLQIWVFPKVRNIQPRYDQRTFNPAERLHNWQLIVSPDAEKDSIRINQDAWFSLADLEPGNQLEYQLHKSDNGVYLFVLNGDITVDGNSLATRDGIGLTGSDSFPISASSRSSLLAIEVPLSL